MITTRTPYRISFFGGGTDYPAWYLKEGGAVLSTTIDKYCYISARYLPPFFDTRHRIVWSHIETVNSISEILHPAVRGGLAMLGFDDSQGLEIHHQGDLPARTGIGSSSTFSVGLIKALHVLRGEDLSKAELTAKAIELEQGVLKENVGSQDQVAAAHGGLNLVQFHTDGRIEVAPATANAARIKALEQHLMLFYTGSTRLGSGIAGAVIAGLQDKKTELLAMRRMVDEGLNILSGTGDLAAFGELLHRAWCCKRELAAGVSNPEIDAIYATARQCGALGGKLLGAGSRGFMLFFVPPEKQAAVKAALSQGLWVPFCFEQQGCTTTYSTMFNEAGC